MDEFDAFYHTDFAKAVVRKITEIPRHTNLPAGRKRRKGTMIDLYYIEDNPDIADTVKEYLEQRAFGMAECS